MNKVVLMGRTTRDVEVRYSGETAVARMTLAVDRRIKKTRGTAGRFRVLRSFWKDS